MSTQIDLIRDSQLEMDILLREIDEVRQEPQNIPEGSTNMNILSPPSHIAADVLHEIPTEDITFRQLGTYLIPHTRFPNMKLLEFRTFSGGMAYQPCCKDIDLMGLFKALQPMEQSSDHLFKVARAWSCIIQSLEGLPKELRWVLATMYNFANDALLRPYFSEDDLWSLRPWLMYWYDAADALLELYHIPASAPVPDWFLRPSELAATESMEPGVEALLTVCRTNSVTSDSNETVLHHPSPYQRTGPNLAEESPVTQSGISAWIAAQPDWSFPEETVDLAPGEFVSRRRRSSSSSSSSVHEISRDSPFQLNPEAMEFDPNQHESTSAGSVSSKAASKNWSTISTPSLADCESADDDEEWLVLEAPPLTSFSPILVPARAETPVPRDI